jgi:catechol 2,3-dioxygenase
MTVLTRGPWGAALLLAASLRDVRSFFGEILDLRWRETPFGGALLSPRGTPLLLAAENPRAPERNPSAPGLYHLAFRVADRPALARRLLRIERSRWPLEGASDHGVSEALYLEGPEGIGIEVYRDRPEADWPRRGEALAMGGRPLDREALAAEAEGRDEGEDPVVLGHVHLQVSDLGASELFYRSLGMRVTQSDMPGARFLAFGEYHHHLGINVWNSRSVRRDPEARGLAGLVLRAESVPEGWSYVDRISRDLDVGLRPFLDRGVFLPDPDEIPVAVLATESLDEICGIAPQD